MDVEVHREYATKIETALRGRFRYAHDSILYAISAWSPVSISNYDASQSSDRGRVAEIFGFDKQRLENNVKDVNNDLSKTLLANVQELLSLADQSLTYYVPTLNKIMTANPSHVTQRKTLLELFARIISIPTNAAEVERELSVYKFLREARRSSTSIINMDTYIRVSVKGFLLDSVCDCVSERFRLNASNKRCATWFWKGWEYENLFNRGVIGYKLADDVHDFEFSLSDNVSLEERQKVHAAANRNREDSQATNIETELSTRRRLLAQRIKGPNSAQLFDEENCRQTIEDLAIVRLFSDAAFTNMDVEVHREYAAKIETALRGRFRYPHDFILYALSAWSPVSISNYDASPSA
ncbi:hypothetical protein Y032_0502g2621 [Ancylostoma ceylanicum]|uniref:Uncharacterized protein n=1 Tax=Ancylostoma ceylanicum TaxID=53326 RepID=A0A016WV52_9BILA|nr:hypothetical protein Y032_0502g2621 [Ancylostoma ceylanicum]